MYMEERIYAEALDQLETDLQDCIRELARIKRKKEQFEQAIAGITGITSGEEEEEPEATGITQAVRDLLRQHPNKWVSAPAVRDKLKSEGFPVDQYAQPLAVVHTTLRRLTNQGELESGNVEGAIRYRWSGEAGEEE